MCGSMADLDPLLAICREHQLLLLEDACQSIGASYKGKFLGTIGDAGTFSFDFVKTITCAEGGAVLTNKEDTYINSDGYSDHGHDHQGTDRGADLHPFLGYNFRISELHSAVGLAQIRRLDEFLKIQKKNHAHLKSILSQVPEISFRSIPDPAGDSCTFLSWFLPTEALTSALLQEMKEAGIAGGHFYWFDHNWHYIRKWDHLKKIITLNGLHADQRLALEKLDKTSFAASDQIISRCVSSSISLLWTEEQTEQKGRALQAAIRKVLSKQKLSV
jgi:8-amino-3,8-dideoxy-alpha-D-manno-octulosonate transaminase